MKATYFPAASLQTWATPEKQFTSIRSSNEEETNWPLQEVFTLQGERHCTYIPAAGWGAVSLIRQLRERTLAGRGAAHATHTAAEGEV